MGTSLRFSLAAGALAAWAGSALALPSYAKAYKTPCSTCHSVPPRLNAAGKLFAERGPAALGLQATGMIPVSLWVSGLAQNSTDQPDEFESTMNRIEAIWFGPVSEKVNVFVEWRALSKEITSAGGIRDRSGRFEDLYATYREGPLELTLGQTRGIAQQDLSQRLTLSEPIALSRSLPGIPTPDSRIQGLRGFSPGGRSPLVRLGWRRLDETGSWNASIAAAFPGEISIPLNNEAEQTASNELSFDTKGFIGEIFRRDGPATYGLFGFTGRNDRKIFGGTATLPIRRLWLEGSIARTDVQGTREWLGSLDLSFQPCQWGFAGFRVDGRENIDPLWVPYIAGYRSDPSGAWKYTVEARAQRNRRTIWVLELGKLF